MGRLNEAGSCRCIRKAAGEGSGGGGSESRGVRGRGAGKREVGVRQ